MGLGFPQNSGNKAARAFAEQADLQAVLGKGGTMRIRDRKAERQQRSPWRRYVRRWASAWIVGCIAAGWSASTPSTHAAMPNPPKATSSRAAKEDAVAGIPFDKLKADVRAKLSGVVEKPSIYRRLPSKTINCDPDMYLFLVRYPEVVVNIWELMGITNVKLKRVGEYTFECSDGAGTVGTVELVYGTQNLHVLYCEATYEGSLSVRKLNGRGVMVLKAEYKKDEQDRSHVENHLDVFIQIDQAGAELIAKTLQPLVGKAADINFHESATFVSRVSQAAETNSPGVQRLAAKLKNCTPEVRAQFADVAAQVGDRAVQQAVEEAITKEARTPPPVELAPEVPAKGKPQLRR